MPNNHFQPTVLTLDAGGTNFVFSAISGMKPAVTPITLPSCADNLDRCLSSMLKGFDQVIKMMAKKPDAISFAFPGPADYRSGIVGDLGNLPCFRGGVPLGPMLAERYGVPVYINNDGDLFAYGEAIQGFLPQVNRWLHDAGSKKRYRNLLGVTLGTGFGGGLVSDGRLFVGDNSAGAEIWLLRSASHPHTFTEETLSIRGLQRIYQQKTNCPTREIPSPKEIFDICEGKMAGNQLAACQTFSDFGTELGASLAEVLTIADSLVVLGGGIANAYKYFAASMIDQINGKISTLTGQSLNRLEIKAFDLENTDQRAQFCQGSPRQIPVPFSHTNAVVDYDPQKRVGIGLSRLGTSQAVAIGAYAFALEKMCE